MDIISICVYEFLNYVCFNPSAYDEMYKYIYRETHFDELGLTLFKSQLTMWRNGLITDEIRNQNLNFLESLDSDTIFERIKKKHKLFDTNFNTVNQILNHGIDANISYTPKHFYLSEEDRNRVLTILDYTDSSINGLSVMDGNEYVGEILDSTKMEKAANLIQNLYDEYKDFQFDVKVLKHPYNNSHKLSPFENLFDLYNNRVRFIIELIDSRQNKKIIRDRPIKGKKYSSFTDIFTVNDWDKYLRALTECNPRLLEYNETCNAYKFIGNEKTEKGCIGQYFKQLKTRGVIDSNINRDELAEVLNSCLIDFSISGASIDNTSKKYEKTFEKQLFN